MGERRRGSIRRHDCANTHADLDPTRFWSSRLLTAGYQPTKAESEEDVSIDATQEEAFRVMFADDPPVVKSDTGEKSMKEFEAWLENC